MCIRDRHCFFRTSELNLPCSENSLYHRLHTRREYSCLLYTSNDRESRKFFHYSVQYFESQWRRNHTTGSRIDVALFRSKLVSTVRSTDRDSPVSYTHLDVYKRQVLAARQQVESDLSQGAYQADTSVLTDQLEADIRSYPVSYTHLLQRFRCLTRMTLKKRIIPNR